MNDEFRIVGRERESCLLEDIYQKSMTCGQVVWIYGASGVGKSALIQEFSHRKKNLCTGKFDFVHSSVPYSVIFKILHDLCSILESGNLTITLGPDTISILSTLIPQIRNVTTFNVIEGSEGGGGGGEQAKTTQFEVKDNKVGERGFERLKQAIRVFMKEAIDMTSSHFEMPTTIIIDDLQWADDASLEILKPLLRLGGGGDNNSWKGFLCIGAYRDNELNDTTPFWHCKKMSNFEKNGAAWTELPLDNLKVPDVIEILSNFLRLAPLQAESLGRLVYDVTRGNALFVRRYLQHMKERKFLSSSQNSDDWNVNEVTMLHAKVLNNEDNNDDGIIAFLAEDISNLPHRAASEILKIASFLGYCVDVDLLESIIQDFEIDTLQYPFLSMLECLESKCFIVMDSDKRSFHFVHDRIHQAACHLCNQEEDVRHVSLRLGRIILNIAGNENACHDSKYRSRFLEAVNQMNRGKELIDTAEDKENLARLNHKAAKEVLRFSAFNVAQNYLKISLELLGANCWDTHYDLTLTISNMLASVLTGNGLMVQSLKLIDEISERSNCVDDRCEAQILKLEVLACMNQLDQCFELSQKMLAELKLPKLPLNPGLTSIIAAMLAIKKKLKLWTSEDILKLPLCENSRIQHAVKIFSILCPVAFLASKESIIPILSCRMMQFTLKFGLTPLSPYVFSSFGFCLTVTQDFREAFRFGSLALQLMQRFGEDARTLVVVYGFIYHTQRHVVDAFEPTLRAYYVSFVQGDLAFSGQAIAMHLYARMVAGSSLDNIINDTFSFAEQLKAYNQSMVWNVMIVIQRTNLELADRSEEIVKLLGENLNDDEFHNFLCGGGHQKFHVFAFLRLTLRCRYILGDKESSLMLAKKCWSCKGIQTPLIGHALFFFFNALMALDCWKEATLTKRFYFWRIFRKYQRILISWTEKGNPNTLHMVSLLKAQVLALKENERFEVILEAYSQSINQGRRSGFLQDVALSNELLGKYCLRRGEYDLAKEFLNTARYLYFDWGAMKKVRLMESQYQSIISDGVMMDQLSTAIKGRAREEIVSEIENLRSQTQF